MPLHPPCPSCSSTGVVSAFDGDDAVALCPGDPPFGEVPCPYALEVERGLIDANGYDETPKEPLPQ